MKTAKNFWTDQKANLGRTIAVVVLFVAPMVGMIGCVDKDDEPCTDYTNPDCPNYNPCWQAQQDYNTANNNYLNTRRQCLQGYLPQCFTDIEGFKDAYDFNLPADDSLLSVQTVVNTYLDVAPQYLVGHEALADSAKQTSIRALDLEAVRDSVYSANVNCLQ